MRKYVRTYNTYFFKETTAAYFIKRRILELLAIWQKWRNAATDIIYVDYIIPGNELPNILYQVSLFNYGNMSAEARREGVNNSN